MMVYSTGQGVHGFTLDQDLGEFILSHPNIQFPQKAQYYSVNQGYEQYWTDGVRRFVKSLQGLDEKDKNEPLGHRYIGSLVSDFHRNMLRGGIYFYPPDIHKPKGKIRLMYEAQAIAFLAEQAGGYASDGLGNVMDIRPHSLHQRIPFFVGNRDLVERAEQYIKEHDQAWIMEYQTYRNQLPQFN